MKAKRSLYNLFFNIISLLITFALGIIIPKLFIVNLGSEANGLVSSVGQIFSYVSLLEAGIGATAIQALYKPIVEDDKNRMNQILSASNRQYKKIGFIYILCIIIIAFVYPLVVSVDLPKWQVIGVICFSGLGSAINFLLQQNYVVLLSAEGKGYVTTNLNLIVNVIVSLSKAILLLNGFNIVSVLGAQFFFTLLRIIFMRIYIKRHYKWLDTNVEPDYSALHNQRYVLVQQISYFVYTNTDVTLLTFMSNLKVVSVYTLYNMIIGVIESVVSAFTSSIVFALGQLYNENFDKFKIIFKAFDSFYMTLVFASFSVVYVFMMPFLLIYTKGITDINYIDYTLTLLFVILKMVQTLRSQSQNVINLAGHFKETQNSSIVEAVMNIVISIIGVRYIGIYGLLIGSIVSCFYKGIVITHYADNAILKASRKEIAMRYVRWVAYILVFVCIYFFVPKILPTSFNSYFQLIYIAIPVALIIFIIYFLIWAVIDINTTKDTIMFVKDRFIKK